MTDEVYIAIDQGGHATRASAYRPATGDLEGAAFVSVATQPKRPRPCRARPGGDRRKRRDRPRRARCRIVAPQRWVAAGLAVQRSSLVCWSADDGRRASRPSSPGRTRAMPRGCAGSRARRGRRRAPDRPAAVAALWREQAALVPRSPAGGPAARRRRSRLRAGPLASYLLHRLLRERPCFADAHRPPRGRYVVVAIHPRMVRGAPRPVRHSARQCCRLRSARRHAFGTPREGGVRIPVGVCNGDQSGRAVRRGRVSISMRPT